MFCILFVCLSIQLHTVTKDKNVHEYANNTYNRRVKITIILIVDLTGENSCEVHRSKAEIEFW